MGNGVTGVAKQDVDNALGVMSGRPRIPQAERRESVRVDVLRSPLKLGKRRDRVAALVGQLVVNLKEQGLVTLNDQRSVGHPSILSSQGQGDESTGVELGRANQYGGFVAVSITPELRAQAWRDADAAADHSRVVVRVLRTIEQFDEGRYVFDEVWPTEPGGTEISAHLTKALVHAGAYMGGAYADDRIIGATLGVVGRSRVHDGWHTHLHSHVAAVLPGFADRGVGAAMKIHQRAWALENDLDRIEWTFDPLVRRNAKFNLAKLGGVGAQYIEDFYGQMNDAVNANDRSDRIVLGWDIASDRVAGAMRGELKPQPRADWLARGAEVALAVSDSNGPQVQSTSASVQLVALPEDIVAIRQHDPQAALGWRYAVREVLQPIIAAGGALVGVTQEGDYVVEAAS